MNSIIFTEAPPIERLLSGQETLTLRVMKNPPTYTREECMATHVQNCSFCMDMNCCDNEYVARHPCPHGGKGDLLWVREPHWIYHELADEDLDKASDENRAVLYRADDPSELSVGWTDGSGKPARWRPSIHMFRRDSRLTVRLVREPTPMRLNDMSQSQAVEAGYGPLHVGSPLERYHEAWERLNAKRGYPWSSNPWVWARTLQRVEENG